MVIIRGHDAPEGWCACGDRDLTGPTEDQGVHVAGTRGGPRGDASGVGVPGGEEGLVARLHLRDERRLRGRGVRRRSKLSKRKTVC